MSRLFELSLLGYPFVRRVDGTENRELTFRLRREVEILAFLALAPNCRASKTDLVGAVWQDCSSDSVAKNFHPTLSALRRDLGSKAKKAIELRQSVYVLDPLLCACDCWILNSGAEVAKELAVSQPEVALPALLAVWRDYRGELMRGYDSAWIDRPREQLRQTYLEVLRVTARVSRSLGEYVTAIDAYRSVLLEEPFEESVHLDLMETYAERGRRDLVRRHYVRYQDLLKRELYVEPRESTQRRYHELMR